MGTVKPEGLTMNEDLNPEAAESQLMQLAAAYESTIERIGEEIHDGPIQYLAGAKMWIDSLLRPGLDPSMAEALTQASTALAEGVHVTRRCMNALRLELPQPCDLISGILSVLRQFKVTPDRITIQGETIPDAAWNAARSPLACRALSDIIKSLELDGRSLLRAQMDFDPSTATLRLALDTTTPGSKITALSSAAGDEDIPTANPVLASDLWKWLGGRVEGVPAGEKEVRWILHLRIRDQERDS